MLYFHIPFCKGKCIYCDFYSGGNPDWNKYLKALASELSERTDELRGDCLSSIYFGGGTPSLIPTALFKDFMRDTFDTLDKADIPLAKDIEFTIEVNPEDVGPETVEAWKEAGVNRVSMGVQSLVDDELRLLRRRHDAERAIKAATLLRENFSNLSLDLIYGIPGQSHKSLELSLAGLLSLSPDHISAYALTFEEGTALDVLRQRGSVAEPSEDIYLELGSLVAQRLEEAGYERYEISNYARPGFRSRHNSGYWSGRPYVGLGPSASSFDGKSHRRTNKADVKGYMDGRRDFEEEFLSREERLEEIVMVGLRNREGVDLSLFTRPERETILKKASTWLQKGDLVAREARLALARHAIPLSDFIILDLLS